MVEATHDGEADGEAGGPAGEDHDEGGRGVVSVLAVEDNNNKVYRHNNTGSFTITVQK